MPFSWSDPRTEMLVRFLNDHPDGVSAREIAACIKPPLPHRTVQRWLAGLVAGGQIRRRGGGHTSRYLLVTARRTNAGLPAQPPHEAVTAGIVAKNAKPTPQVDNVSETPLSDAGLPPGPVVADQSNRATQTKAERQSPEAVDPRYAELLKRVVPLIVRKIMPRANAEETLLFEGMKGLGNDSAVINPFIKAALAELDGLTVMNLSRYSIRTEDFDLWRKYWKR